MADFVMTEQMETFCQAIAAGVGRGEAARRARPDMTPGSAAASASRWLRLPEVILRIGILRGATVDGNISAIESMVYDKPLPPNFTLTSTETRVITNNDREKIVAGLWKVARVCLGEEFAEKEVQDKDGNVLSFERHRAMDAKSALRALELLGKIDNVGLFVERKRFDIKTDVENMSDEELDKEIAKYSSKLN